MILYKNTVCLASLGKKMTKSEKWNYSSILINL